MPKTLPMILQWDESFDIGSDTLTGVNDADYQPPFTLTAKLNKLTIKVDRPQLSPEDIKKLEAAQSRTTRSARAPGISGGAGGGADAAPIRVHGDPRQRMAQLPHTRKHPDDDRGLFASGSGEVGICDREATPSLIWAFISISIILAALAVILSPLHVSAQTGKMNATELAKQTQNPVADLISVPFQNNFNFGVGPRDVTQWVLNIQPVIPISLNRDWNLITRTIMPIINQPSPAPGVESAFGLGDINPTLFLSPVGSRSLIWGLGPTFTLPTATDSLLGSGKWSAGPAAVALTMQGPWVVGALANTQWSFAGWGDKYFAQTLIQPFINYNFAHGWYLSSAPIITCNWEADSGDQWTVPVGAGGGKVLHLGRLPVNTQLQAYYNVATPDNGPDWQLRFQVQFLFPK